MKKTVPLIKLCVFDLVSCCFGNFLFEARKSLVSAAAIKIIMQKVSQLFLGVNYVGMKNQLTPKSFPGGFLR